MGFCIDKSTRFLRRLGYNVVRHPGEGLAPLDLIGWENKSPLHLGTLDQLMVSATEPLPQTGPPLSGANIDGKTTSKLPLSIGLDVFGAVIGAMGGNLGVKASYEASQTIEFSYHNVEKLRTNPVALGSYLRGGDVDWDNPVLHRYLLEGGKLFVVLEVVRTDTFGLTAYDKSKSEIKVDVPTIRGVVGGEVDVSYDGQSQSKVTYKGTRKLVFGFKCAELAAVDDEDTGELKLCFKPVKEGTVYFNIGDVDEVPDFSILSETGLIDGIAMQE